MGKAREINREGQSGRDVKLGWRSVKYYANLNIRTLPNNAQTMYQDGNSLMIEL